MKKVIVRSSLTKIQYPVGLYMKHNLPIINEMAKVIKQNYRTEEKIALWCRGSSGAIIAAILSTKIPNAVINHVKKDGEESHSNRVTIHCKYHIIVDDFISTGATIKAIHAKIKSYDSSINVDCIVVSGAVSSSDVENYCDTLICQRNLTKTC